MLFKIYKITCSETGKIYIGSTCRSLRRRLKEHKDKKRGQCMTRDFIDPKIEMIDLCEDREEMLLSEKFFILQTNCVNKYTPCQTNIEKKEYKASWYQENAERIKQKGQVMVNCACGAKIKKCSLAAHLKSATHLNNL